MDIFKQIDDYLIKNKDRWVNVGNELMRMPEIGFCEINTSQYVKNWFERIGLKNIKQAAVTGQIAKIEGRDHLVDVAFIAELDAIYCPTHPLADNKTGLAHACGHHMQITALLAVAEALQETGVMSELDGDISLIAVPAEENIPEPVLKKLRDQGKIETECGKKELLRLGLLDDIDIVLATHSLINDESHPDQVMVNSSCNGLSVLKFSFKGTTAHSMVCPEKGANALNAAVLAINGIQAIRDSFDPQEYIRVSYNLTDGGISIGNVPDLATLEVVIATKSLEALKGLEHQITVAAESGAKVLKCSVVTSKEIEYLPYEVDEKLLKTIQTNGFEVIGKTPRLREHNYFSNDLGNVSQIIPSAQVVFGGFSGGLHSNQFKIEDEENAYLLPARIMARTLLDLLQNKAEEAKKIIDN